MNKVSQTKLGASKAYRRPSPLFSQVGLKVGKANEKSQEKRKKRAKDAKQKKKKGLRFCCHSIRLRIICFVDKKRNEKSEIAAKLKQVIATVSIDQKTRPK
jgi:hypothetical protein